MPGKHAARCDSQKTRRSGTPTAMMWSVELTTNARRRTMTATINHTCDKTETPLSRDEVKKMLRDAAYVLHLTRRVKAEIMADRPETARTDGLPRRSEMAAGLGV